VDVDQLASDEPLSPELVLVLPPELRAQALDRLGAPVWPKVRLRVPEPSQPEPWLRAPDPRPEPLPVVEGDFASSLGELVVARAVQLGLIFASVTILTLAMSVVAHAIR
jgi:hypothetical protein